MTDQVTRAELRSSILEQSRRERRALSALPRLHARPTSAPAPRARRSSRRRPA